jgi:hypothetical protein
VCDAAAIWVGVDVDPAHFGFGVYVLAVLYMVCDVKRWRVVCEDERPSGGNGAEWCLTDERGRPRCYIWRAVFTAMWIFLEEWYCRSRRNMVSVYGPVLWISVLLLMSGE